MPSWIVFITLVSAVATPIGGWVVIRRKTKGTVKTSEAGDLWAATDRLQLRMEAEITRRDAQIGRLEGRVDECLVEAEQLRAEIVKLRAENNRLTHENAELWVRIRELEGKRS